MVAIFHDRSGYYSTYTDIGVDSSEEESIKAKQSCIICLTNSNSRVFAKHLRVFILEILMKPLILFVSGAPNEIIFFHRPSDGDHGTVASIKTANYKK